MAHRVIGGKILIDGEQPEGEQHEFFEVLLTYRPLHGTTPEQLGYRIKELRKKLDKFYEKLAEDYE